jgi:hypothetical protein
MTCKLRWTVRLTRVIVSFVSYPSIWSCGEGAVCFAYSKSACKFRPPRERACRVLVQTRYCYMHCHQSALLLEARSGNLEGSRRRYHEEPDHAGTVSSKSEVSRNTNSRHSFGDGINPRKHRHAGRPLRLTLRTLPSTRQSTPTGESPACDILAVTKL